MRRLFLLAFVLLLGCGGSEEPSPAKMRAERAVRSLRSGPATAVLCADVAQFGNLTAVPPEVRRKCDDLLVAQREEKKQRAATALAAMKSSRDEVEGTTWYQDPSSSDGATDHFYLYFGEGKDGLQPLHMRIAYLSDEPIDPDTFTLFADGKKYSDFALFHRARERKGRIVVAGGPYSDFADAKANAQELELLRTMVTARTAIVRLTGRGLSHDHELTAEEQRAMGNVLAAWDAKQK